MKSVKKILEAIPKKQLYLASAALVLVVVGLVGFLLLRHKDPAVPGGDLDPSSGVGEVSQAESGDVSSEETNASSGESSEEPEPYVSPIDFEEQWEQCEDIYAWLWIPGTDVYPGRNTAAPEISYPVAQSQTDDVFYLEHGIDGKKNQNGTLYTEHRYNNLEFSDRVTIIYGHNMRSGLMFGYLQEQFSNTAWFEEHEDIFVYQPNRTLRYRVFAAVPYGIEHILYKYKNFPQSSDLTEFLDSIYAIRKLGTNYNEDCEVTGDDRILILSTCLPVSANGRYLVLAKLEEVIGAPLDPIEE